MNRDAELLDDSRQFLTFTLANEEYCVDILKVQEIRGYIEATPLPNAPEDNIGVINLRGTIVPVFDLRQKFGLPKATYTASTVIVVVVVDDRISGMLVDSVSEVMNLSEDDIQPPPKMEGTSGKALQGLGIVNDRLIILLDLDELLREESRGKLPQAA